MTVQTPISNVESASVKSPSERTPIEIPEDVRQQINDDYRLSQMKTDELIIVDLVTQASRNVELITPDAVFEQFKPLAQKATCPTAKSLLEEADRQLDNVVGRPAGGVSKVYIPKKGERDQHRDTLPSTRSQREAFTRREMLAALLTGTSSPQALLAQANEAEAKEAELANAQAPTREITREYFNEVLDNVLADDCGVYQIQAWDNQLYLHYRPLLSSSYAKLLTAQNNPVEMVCEFVRDSSALYPSPVLVASLQSPPFNFEAETIEELLRNISADPNCKDIRCTQSSLGTVYLYSDRYLSDDYADFLAEHLDVSLVSNP